MPVCSRVCNVAGCRSTFYNICNQENTNISSNAGRISQCNAPCMVKGKTQRRNEYIAYITLLFIAFPERSINTQISI